MNTECIALCFTKIKYDDTNLFERILKLIKMHSHLVKIEAIKRHQSLTLFELHSNFGLLDLDKTHGEMLDEFTYGRQQYKDFKEENNINE